MAKQRRELICQTRIPTRNQSAGADLEQPGREQHEHDEVALVVRRQPRHPDRGRSRGVEVQDDGVEHLRAYELQPTHRQSTC